jgi:16S rRNA G966 N2-methylase RsmD
MTWENRIIGYKLVKASELTAHPENWREHPEAQKQAMQGVLDSVGWVDAAIYNVRTNRLIDGHLRKDLAADALIPVLEVDLSEEEESLVLATFDPISAMATANKERLAGLLEKAKSLATDPRIREMMEKLRRQHGVNTEPAPTRETPIKKSLAELQEKWQVQAGQIWRHGDISLYCGRWQDSPAIQANLVITDPPYNTTSLEFDEAIDLGEFWERCPRSPSKPTVFLITASGRFMWELHSSNPKEFRYEWVWEKPYVTNPLDANRMPMRCHEYGLVFCAQNPPYYPVFEAGEGYTHFRTGEIDHHKKQRDSNVLTEHDFRYTRSVVKFGLDANISTSNLKEGQVLANHPTQKPLDLWAMWVCSYTEKGETIFDPFGGSGVSLVAAAQLERKALACEINPEYCALALERLSQLNIEMKPFA